MLAIRIHKVNSGLSFPPVGTCPAQPLAVGRLEDKSAFVRKQALLALSSMLSFNPFAPQLPEDRFVATLNEYEGKLRVSFSPAN